MHAPRFTVKQTLGVVVVAAVTFWIYTLYERSLRYRELAVFHEQKEQSFLWLQESLDRPGRRLTDGGIIWEENRMSARERRLLRREYTRRQVAHRRMRYLYERAERLPWLQIEPDPTIRVVSVPPPQVTRPPGQSLISSFEAELAESGWDFRRDEEDARRTMGLADD